MQLSRFEAKARSLWCCLHVSPLVFSSLPYHLGFFHRGLYATPRSIVALPHLTTYSLLSKVFEESGFFGISLVSFLVRMFWVAFDAHLAE